MNETECTSIQQILTDALLDQNKLLHYLLQYFSSRNMFRPKQTAGKIRNSFLENELHTFHKLIPLFNNQ